MNPILRLGVYVLVKLVGSFVGQGRSIGHRILIASLPKGQW